MEQVTREGECAKICGGQHLQIHPPLQFRYQYGNGACLYRDGQITEKLDYQEHFLASNHFAASQDSGLPP